MKVIVWSDFTSPASYLAQIRLQHEIKALNLTDKIEYEARAYQVDPDASKEAIETNAAKLSLAKDITLEKAQDFFTKWKEEGKDVGIDLEAGFAYNTNTLDAHRLIAWVQDQYNDSEKTEALVDAIFKAEFTNNENISDHQVLLNAVKETGLNETDAKEVLNSNAYQDVVIEQEASFRDLAVDKVPVVIIDQQVLAGLQPSEEYARALDKKAGEFINDYLMK